MTVFFFFLHSFFYSLKVIKALNKISIQSAVQAPRSASLSALLFLLAHPVTPSPQVLHVVATQAANRDLHVVATPQGMEVQCLPLVVALVNAHCPFELSRRFFFCFRLIYLCCDSHLNPNPPTTTATLLFSCLKSRHPSFRPRSPPSSQSSSTEF